jgi:hypothetical protein
MPLHAYVPVIKDSVLVESHIQIVPLLVENVSPQYISRWQTPDITYHNYRKLLHNNFKRE